MCHMKVVLRFVCWSCIWSMPVVPVTLDGDPNTAPASASPNGIPGIAAVVSDPLSFAPLDTIGGPIYLDFNLDRSCLHRL